MAAYYNEIDPFAAAWLRELIKAGHIADGEVDERSITDVRPDDLRGFDQCHFFAGIGGWSLALRLAGWPDDRAVWTGSCPCQPFSSAGAQAGGHDPRDLWPVWFQLVAECRPLVVFGEQVEAAIGHGWLDRVCDDLEAEGYAVGACGLPAASVGAFHIRQRLWFVADRECNRCEEGRGADTPAQNRYRPHSYGCGKYDARAGIGELADADGRHAEHRGLQRGWQYGLRAESGRVDRAAADDERAESDMADTDGERRTRERLLLRPETTRRDASEVPEVAWSGESRNVADTDERGELRNRRSGGEGAEATPHRRCEVDRGVPSRFWSDVDWLPCTDGKARPVEPGTFPLAHGVSTRVGRLRGYGNAIVPACGAEFIKAYREAVGENLHGL